MMCYSFQATARRLCGKVIQGPKEGVFTGVSIDSRAVRPGSLFIAIRGKRFDGHDYLQQALDNGASAVMVQRKPDGVRIPARRGVIGVRNTRKALGELAALHRLRHPGAWIAVTGSIGKSTTKEWIAHILQSTGEEILKAEKSFNNDIGVPLTVLRAKPRHQAFVMELGSNAPGEITGLAEICRPTIAAITCAAPAHLEGLGDVNGVAREKGAILDRLYPDDIAILNLDDPYYRYWKRRTDANVYTFSETGNPNADFYASHIQTGRGSLHFSLNGDSAAFLPVPGKHQVRNALIAIATASVAGMDVPDILHALATVPMLSGRQTIIELAGGITILDDSYNASPAAFSASLDFFRQIGASKRKIVVAGDMLELGKHFKYWHHEIGTKIAAAGTDRLLAIGKHASAYASGAFAGGMSADGIEEHDSMPSALMSLAGELGPDTCILVKGSNSLGLHKLVDGLQLTIGEALPIAA